MPEKHIFLSYNHKHKDVVFKIRDRLKAEGHSVWIDSDNMSGSLMDSMAQAVENAKLVIICVSEHYGASDNCKKEATYADSKKVPIIPLMMQRYFKPDGWLGLLMVDKLYINFDGKFEFDDAFKILLSEIDKCIGTKGEKSPYDEYNAWFMDPREEHLKMYVKWTLLFKNNTFTGKGDDEIGPFEIKEGKLLPGAKIEFIKEYATHRIRYEGVCDRAGIPTRANGTWQIDALDGTWGMEHV